MNESNDIFYVSLKSNEASQSKYKKNKKTNKKTIEKPIKEPQYLKYKVVVGSFSTAKNAIELKDQLVEKGYDAFILHKERELIRVVAGDFATEQEAKELISKLAATQITGWIYK
jgi:cell division septation protein DedD